MKKITLSALIIMTSIISLQAQLYTPSGAIQGSSSNNFVGIGTSSPTEKITIQGNHKDTRFLLHSTGGGDAARQADLTLWASESGLSYTGVGIGNNIHNNKNDLGGISLLNPARGGSYIRLLDNSMLFNVVSSSGTDKQALSIDQNGNIGIGTTSPSSKLSVLGNISKLTLEGVDGVYDNLIKYGHKSDLESGTNYANRWHGIDATITAGLATSNKLKFKLYGGTIENKEPIDVMTLVGNGNVGIGTTNPMSKLTIAGGNPLFLSHGGSSEVPFLAVLNSSVPTDAKYGWAFYDNQTNGNLDIYRRNGTSDGIQLMTFNRNTGDVSIGSTEARGNKLAVKGTIGCEEVIVKSGSNWNWPDYVFANNYKLKSLQEVEEFIKQNSHLPEIPSAKEIEKNGLMLAEINMSLLKKIEELTLYSIEQSKEIKSLKVEIQAFKSLSERLSKIEKQLK